MKTINISKYNTSIIIREIEYAIAAFAGIVLVIMPVVVVAGMVILAFNLFINTFKFVLSFL